MSNSSVPLLSAHSITKSFGPRTARHQVLFDVSADVHAGECLAVIGGSGSGKSTLTRIMLGLESADSGSVEYESQSIVGGRKSPGFAALRRESGLVFQDPFSSLDPRWRVAKSVAEPLSLQRRDLNNTDIDERVAAALTMAGLEPADFLNRYPIDLSGGQAQRVVIARAIINEPKVILADEPMSAIDVAARRSSTPSPPSARPGRAPPSSWSPTISAWCSTSPTASSCFTTGASKRRVPPPKCSATPNPITPVSSSRQPRYRPFWLPSLRGAGRRRHALVAGCAMV